MSTKPFWQSGTLWVNVLSVVAVAVALILQQAKMLDLTTQQIAWFTIVLGVINAALRVLVTNQPISGSRAAHMLARHRNHLYVGK